MSGYRFDWLKILIVDDNVHMCKVVSAILHGAGVQHVATVHSDDQAREMLGEFKPDIVILDNIDLVRKIRAGETSPDVPIIMLTSNASVARVQAARDAGVTEVLAKPVSAQAIYSRLVAIAERPRPFVRANEFVGPDRRRRGGSFNGPDRRGD